MKGHRADLWREISRLTELSDLKSHEASQHVERLHALNSEINRVQIRIEDLTKTIERQNHDLH